MRFYRILLQPLCLPIQVKLMKYKMSVKMINKRMYLRREI